MKKHLMFVSVPAHGHVNPTLPLVEELVRRGHRVTYATHERFGQVVEASGATLLPLVGEMPARPPKMEFTPELMARMMEHFVEQARASFPALLEHARQDPADAVCFDMMTFTGRMLAEKLKLPDIALMPSFASNEQFSLRDEFLPSSFDPTQGPLADAGRKFHEFAAEHGIGEAGPPFGGAPASHNVVFIPREFQLAIETFDDRFCFAGPSVGSRASDPSWQPPEGSKPLLFISLGTAFNDRPEFFQMCLEAFGDGEWNVAMAVGEDVGAGSFTGIPDNFDVRAYFPQPAVLKHATAFLSHAGMNSTMESLYEAVPLVAVPQMPEQEANARRVEELGLGRRLDTGAVTPELLRTAVDEVSGNEEIRRNLRSNREVLHKAGGAVTAADSIETFLETTAARP